MVYFGDKVVPAYIHMWLVPGLLWLVVGWCDSLMFFPVYTEKVESETIHLENDIALAYYGRQAQEDIQIVNNFANVFCLVRFRFAFVGRK